MLRSLLVLLPVALGLSGCTGVTSDGRIQAEAKPFGAPISVSAGTVESWRLSRVDVNVPASLTVSRDPNEQFPRNEIVWYGEPYGDRRAQVRRIVGEAVQAGASGLNGRRGVVLDVDLKLFHAVTPRAVSNRYYAWHDIQFVIQVRDARDGAVLATSVPINADLEAYRGEEAKAAAARGDTQKARISSRIMSVVHAWLQSSGATINPPRITTRRAAPAPVRQQPRRAPPAPSSAPRPVPAEEKPAQNLPDPPGVAPVMPDPPSIAATAPEDSLSPF